MRAFFFFAGTFIGFGIILGVELFGAPNPPINPDAHQCAYYQDKAHPEQGCREPTADELTAHYTLWLDAWTAGLVAVALGQAGMFFFQLRLMREGMDDTRAAVIAAKDAAAAAGEQTRLTRESTDLSRDEFIASHRPLLIIHSINLLGFADDKPPDEQPLRASFVVINAGTGTGTILSSALYLEYAESIDAPWRQRAQLNDIIKRQRYPVGSAITARITGDEWSGLHHVNRELTPKNLYFFGWILYADERHNQRTGYFCRMYDPKAERFMAIDDPEANQTY